MHYWLHRISHHAEVAYPLLDNNILTIGFSAFATQAFIDDMVKPAHWSEKWPVLESYFDKIWEYRPRTRHNLWRFTEGFKQGDRVIVPTWGGTFSVYELVSEQPRPISSLSVETLTDWHGNPLTLYEGGLYVVPKKQKEAKQEKPAETKQEEDYTFIDLGFYWKVKPIAVEISRKDYADTALTARMKMRMTNALIDDLKESVDQAVDAFKQGKPINLHAQIMEKYPSEILNLITSQLTPDKFEHLVKFYFEKCGASEVYIPPKNAKDKNGERDADADVVAVFESIKTSIYAQVKFHKVASETDDWAVKQIKAYRQNKESMDDGYAKVAWVISSANQYTEACVKLAQEENILLIHGTRFAEMLLEVGLMDLNVVR